MLARNINRKFNVPSLGLKVDITKEKNINACREIIKKFKTIDGLVNNAANNPKIEKIKIKIFQIGKLSS